MSAASAVAGNNRTHGGKHDVLVAFTAGTAMPHSCTSQRRESVAEGAARLVDIAVDDRVRVLGAVESERDLGSVAVSECCAVAETAVNDGETDGAVGVRDVEADNVAVAGGKTVKLADMTGVVETDTVKGAERDESDTVREEDEREIVGLMVGDTETLKRLTDDVGVTD